MSKRKLYYWLIGLALVVIAYIVIVAWPPKRPANVPKGAVFVPTAKMGWWEYCRFDPVQRTDHCQMFLTNGSIAREDDFLPYDGGAPVEADELKIDPHTDFAGDDRIILRNGRILLPKSIYEHAKKFWDNWEPFPHGLRRTWSASPK
jgi:hypothetical protein